jgi:flagellar protein FlgJ
MKTAQIRFVKQHLEAAFEAGNSFNMNPAVILAQAALESGWGTSRLSKEQHNYFGLTAYGCSNAYWHGERKEVSTATYTLYFRCYDSPLHSFLDFARLIRNGYRSAWQVSHYAEAYAKEIAYSRYITEANGDNREQYRRSLVQLSHQVAAIIQLITQPIQYEYEDED